MLSSNSNDKKSERGEKRPGPTNGISAGLDVNQNHDQDNQYPPLAQKRRMSDINVVRQVSRCSTDAMALARLPPKNINGKDGDEGQGNGQSILLTSNYLPATNSVSPKANANTNPLTEKVKVSPAAFEDPRVKRQLYVRSTSSSSSSASLSPVSRNAEIANAPRRSSIDNASSSLKLDPNRNPEAGNVKVPQVKGLSSEILLRNTQAVKAPPQGQDHILRKPSLPEKGPEASLSVAASAASNGIENITMRPRLDWILSQPLSQCNFTSISLWKKIGVKDDSLNIEPKFCDARVLEELTKHKIFYHTKLSNHESQSSRARANPFERLENGIFQNRAGMKLANIDADLNFFLSEPRRPDGSHFVAPGDILSFADICGGPGGFSEYLLYRRGFEVKGFGITLRDTVLDFDLKEFQAGPLECYEIFYGDSNNGDIYDPANVKSFVDLVLLSTDKQGVHLVVADGGVEVTGDQFLRQESICKQLYLSQFLIGLSIVADGGIFVCKLFETNTKFTIDLIYLLHLCFDQMTIYKPRMSRPQNSERYIVCLNKRPRIETEPITKYFLDCHELMWDWSLKEQQHLQMFDINELVPMNVLLQQPKGSSVKESLTSEFCVKMQRFNYTIMKNQCEALKNLRLFVNDPLLQFEGQDEMRRKCCEEWRVPYLESRRLKRRGPPIQEMTDETFNRLWQRVQSESQSSKTSQLLNISDLKERKLTLEEFNGVFKSPYDWRVVVVQGNASTFKQSRGFYMGQGGTDVFRYNMSRDEWEEAPITIELPKDTLVYGECVQEFEGYGALQRKVRVFHIIDALVINGKDLFNHHYVVRHGYITKLAKSVSKGSRGDLSLVRAKQLVRMENIADILDKCEKQELKGEDGQHWTCPIDHTDERSPLIKAAGILFLKLTKDPWMMTVNDRNHRKYWLNLEDGSSTYDFTQLAVSSFWDTMKERTIWNWTDDTILEVPDPDLAQIVSPERPVNHLDLVHSYHFLERKYFRHSPQQVSVTGQDRGLGHNQTEGQSSN